MSWAQLGWAVVHTAWLGTAIGAAAILALSGMPHAGPARRHDIALWALLAMLVGPVVVAVAVLDPLTPGARASITRGVDATIGFSTFVSWRGTVVQWAAAFWLAGVVVHGVRVALEWRRLRRWCAGIEAVDDALTRQAADLARTAGIRRPVHVRHSSEATAPLVYGWREPTVLVPTELASWLTPRQVRAVLTHELAHVQRHDYLTNLVQIGIDAVLWFHPLARWLSCRARTEREYCCDDAALASSRAADYARALARLDDARDPGRLVVAAASGTLLDRIQRIAGEARSVPGWRTGLTVFVLASTAAALWLSLALAVPPGVPLNARLRQRTPGATGPAAPGTPSIPRRSPTGVERLP